MKKNFILTLMFSVIILMFAAINVSALSGIRWSTQTQGVFEFDRKAETRYRIDVFKDGRDLNLTTTIDKSAEDKVYVHSFMPYLIERNDEGIFTIVLNVIDDFGNVVSTSEPSEPFEYKKPQLQLTAVSESYFDGGYFYFKPSTEEQCRGYSLVFSASYGEKDIREFYSSYYLDERLDTLEKNADGYYVFDLETIRPKYDQGIARYFERDPEKYNPENAKVAVGVKALPMNIMEYNSADMPYNITDKTDVFDKPYTEKIRVDVSKYGKNINDVLVLEIGKTYVSVFGKPGMNDVAPMLNKGRTMLPIRFIAENLGAEVSWDEATKTVTIIRSDVNISLVVGESVATINGEVKELDAPSFVDTGRTYLPVRFVAENLGAEVLWDDETKSVIISK